MTSEEKQIQEFNSLRNIPDSFKKIVIVNGSKKPWRNDEGFVIMGMKYFLLNADSFAQKTASLGADKYFIDTADVSPTQASSEQIIRLDI